MKAGSPLRRAASCQAARPASAETRTSQGRSVRKRRVSEWGAMILVDRKTPRRFNRGAQGQANGRFAAEITTPKT